MSDRRRGFILVTLSAIFYSSLGIIARYIYMTGLEAAGQPAYVEDPRRFASHVGWVTPWKTPVLPKNHAFITIWGYWNGPDERLAFQDGEYWQPVDLGQAVLAGYIEPEHEARILEQHRRRLAAAGAEDLNLKPDHLLLTVISPGRLLAGEDGQLAVRHCNFETMRMYGIGPADAGAGA